jgi:hypothetical protein
MNHIILQFAETPDQEVLDLSMVEYDRDLNLNVIKGTKIPAVTFADLATSTATKTSGEGVDSDKDFRSNISQMMGTSTQTRVRNESSDNDPSKTLMTMLDTSTKTFTKTEESDSDKNLRDLAYLSATRTLTESSETLDNDK